MVSDKEPHLPERRLLSFILLLPCLGLSRFPLESSEPHESPAPGIWNAESTELMWEVGTIPSETLSQGSRSSNLGITWGTRIKAQTADSLESHWPVLPLQAPHGTAQNQGGFSVCRPVGAFSVLEKTCWTRSHMSVGSHNQNPGLLTCGLVLSPTVQVTTNIKPEMAA